MNQMNGAEFMFHSLLSLTHGKLADCIYSARYEIGEIYMYDLETMLKFFDLCLHYFFI